MSNPSILIFDLDNVSTFIPFSAARYSTLKGKQIQHPELCIDVSAFPPTCVKLAISLDSTSVALNNVSRYSCLLHRLMELTPIATDINVFAPISTSTIMKSHFLEACRQAGINPRQVIQIPALMAQRTLGDDVSSSQTKQLLLTIHLTLRRLEASLFSVSTDLRSRHCPQLLAHSSMRVDISPSKRPIKYLTAFYEDDELAAASGEPTVSTGHFLHTEIRSLFTSLMRQQSTAVSEITKFSVLTDMADHQTSLMTEVATLLGKEISCKPQKVELESFPTLLQAVNFTEKFPSVLGGAVGFELIGFKCPSLLPPLSPLPISRIVPVTATSPNNDKMWFTLSEIVQDAPLGPPTQYKQIARCNVKSAAATTGGANNEDNEYSLEVEISVNALGAPRVSIKDSATGVRQLISSFSESDAKYTPSQAQDGTDTATTIDSDPHRFNDEVSPSESPSLRSSVEETRLCSRLLPASSSNDNGAFETSTTSSTRKCSPASVRLSRHRSADTSTEQAKLSQCDSGGSGTSRRKASPVLESRLHSRQMLTKRAQDALRPLCAAPGLQGLKPSSLTRSALEAASSGKCDDSPLGLLNQTRVRLHTNPNMRHESEATSVSSVRLKTSSSAAAAEDAMSTTQLSTSAAALDHVNDQKCLRDKRVGGDSQWRLFWDDSEMVILRLEDSNSFMGFYKAGDRTCVPFSASVGCTEEVVKSNSSLRQVFAAFEVAYKTLFNCDTYPNCGRDRAEVLDLCSRLQGELSVNKNNAFLEEQKKLQAIKEWLSGCPNLNDKAHAKRLAETRQSLMKMSQGIERCKSLKARTTRLVEKADAMSLPSETRQALAELSADLQSMVGDRLTEDSEKILTDLESNLFELKERAVMAKIESLLGDMFMSKFGSQMPQLPSGRGRSGDDNESSSAIDRLLIRCSIMSDTAQMVGRLEMCIRRIRDEYRRRHYDKLYRQQYGRRLRKSIRKSADKLWGTNRSVTMSDLEAHISELELVVGEDLGPLVFMKYDLEQHITKVQSEYAQNSLALLGLSEGQRRTLIDKCAEINAWLHQGLELGDIATMTTTTPGPYKAESKTSGPPERGRPSRDICDVTTVGTVDQNPKVVIDPSVGKEKLNNKEAVAGEGEIAADGDGGGDTKPADPHKGAADVIDDNSGIVTDESKAKISLPTPEGNVKEVNSANLETSGVDGVESTPKADAVNRPPIRGENSSSDKSTTAKPKGKGGVLSLVDPTKIAVFGERMAQRKKEIDDMCEAVVTNVKEALVAKGELDSVINETIDHYENELRTIASPLECHEATSLIFNSVRWSTRHAHHDLTSAQEYTQQRLFLQDAYNRLVLRIKSSHRSIESQRYGVESILNLSALSTSCETQRRSTDIPFTPQTARAALSPLPFPFAKLPTWTPKSFHFA